LIALVSAIYLHPCSACTADKALGFRIYNYAILWSVNFYCAGTLVVLWLWLKHPTTQRAQWLLVLMFGVGLIFGNGTSAGLSEISAFLGIAILFAALLRLAQPYLLASVMPLLLMGCFMAYLVEHKFTDPYYWWAIESPDIRSEQCADATGILSGLCVPPEKYAKMQQIVEAIHHHSTPGAPIYVFPHMPIFYLLSDHPPIDGAVVSWFDFMSDRQARRVSDTLAKTPPEVMVVAQLPELVLSTHERLFRGGAAMGQRAIIETIMALVRDHKIVPIATIEQLDGLTVVVYARTSRGTK
jgi:hypothetical protein